MEWIRVSVYTSTFGIDAVCDLLMVEGISGFEIEDENEFNEFLENNTKYWDYSNNKFNIDGRVCLTVDSKRIFDCDVIVKGTQPYCQTYNVITKDQIKDQNGNYASMSINAKIFDGSYSEQVWDQSKGQFIDKTTQTDSNVEIELQVESNSIVKSYYIEKNGVKYYIYKNKLYSDEERTREVTTIDGIMYKSIVYTKIKINSRPYEVYSYNSSPFIYKDHTYEYKYYKNSSNIYYNYLYNLMLVEYNLVYYLLDKSIILFFS